MPEPLRLKGIAASSGYAEGPLFPLAPARGRISGARRRREAEADALRAALAHATARIGTLMATASEESAAILEFQLAMLEDKALTEPAFAAIAEGTVGLRRLGRCHRCRDRRLRGFRRRLFPRPRRRPQGHPRDRCCAALSDGGDEASPPGAILFGDDIAPTRFLETDWSHGGGIALTAGSTASHVAMLARSRGVPMVVGLGAAAIEIDGVALLDAEHGGIVLSPTAADVESFRRAAHEYGARRALANDFLLRAAATKAGTAVRVQVNIADPVRRRRDRHRHLRRRRADAHRVPVRQGVGPARRGDAVRRLPQGAGMGGRQAGHHPHRRCRRRQAGAGLHGRGEQSVPRPARHQAVAGPARDLSRADPRAAARRAARQSEGDVPDDRGGRRI